MICIKCFHEKTQVTNSRQSKKHPSVWRRRVCPKCGHIATTYEQPVSTALKITNQAGTENDFNLGKLIISIARSFHHCKNSADRYSYDLALTVQEKLILAKPPLSTRDIATITHSTLKNFDHVAALQYAAQHGLISSQRSRRGRPTFSYVDDVVDRSSRP